MIQVRHVSDEVHRALKARAARAGMSLSDYLRVELERVAERAEVEDLLAEAEAAASVPASGFRRVWREVRAERDDR